MHRTTHQQHRNQNITSEHIVITKMKRIRFLNKAVRYHTRMNNIFTRIAFIKKRDYPRLNGSVDSESEENAVCVCMYTMVVDEPSLFHIITLYLFCSCVSHLILPFPNYKQKERREKKEKNDDYMNIS